MIRDLARGFLFLAIGLLLAAWGLDVFAPGNMPPHVPSVLALMALTGIVIAGVLDLIDCYQNGDPPAETKPIVPGKSYTSLGCLLFRALHEDKWHVVSPKSETLFRRGTYGCVLSMSVMDVEQSIRVSLIHSSVNLGGAKLLTPDDLARLIPLFKTRLQEAQNEYRDTTRAVIRKQIQDALA